MQVVILAAGLGTRMGELTKTTPKPMLLYKGKNLIEYKIDALPEEVDEIIMVVGYLKEVIIDYFGTTFKGKRIKYVVMDELKGTASALWLCREFLKGHFMVMMGDDLYHPDDVRRMMSEQWALLVKRFDEPRRGGVDFDAHGFFMSIDEELAAKGPTFVSTALYTMGIEIFQYPLVKIPGKEEYGLPHTLLGAAHKFPIKLLFTENEWIQITSPEDLK